MLRPIFLALVVCIACSNSIGREVDAPPFSKSFMNFGKIELGRDTKFSIARKFGETYFQSKHGQEHYSCYKSSGGKKFARILYIGWTENALVSGVEVSTDPGVISPSVLSRCRLLPDSFWDEFKMDKIFLGAKKDDIEKTYGPMNNLSSLSEICPGGFEYEWRQSSIADAKDDIRFFLTKISMQIDSMKKLKSITYYQYDGT